MRSNGKDDREMKLYRNVLVMTLVGGAALMVGCGHSNNNGGNDNNAAPADNAAAASTTPVSDTDSTDETAPTAPPAPQADSQGTAPAPTYVYVQGSWRYTGGRYAWTKGHWEPPHSGAQLVQARWVEVSGKWEHHPARWTGGGHAAPTPAAAHPGEEHPAGHR
jgi:hypothetical protein